MSEIQESLYLKTIIVPIARPDTAAQMLQLASDLVDPDDGRVVALTVGVNDDAQSTSERLEELEPIVEQFERAELVTQIASSITRGILDATREVGAEAIIIGVYRSDRREIKLGTLVENVIEAAPCNVLVYRTGDKADFERVIVPLDDNPMTPMALSIGATIASAHKVPIGTPYIQRDYTSSRDKEQRFRDILDSVPDDLREKQEFVTGRTPAETLLQRLEATDLLVLGFSQRANLDLEFGRDISDMLLRRSSGPVLLYSQILSERRTVLGLLQRSLQRFNPALTQVERNEMVWGAHKSSLPSIDYNVLIMMAAGLASLGLLLNSAAVIIGAMLVAPLMSPLGALAVGMASGRLPTTRRAAVTLLQGVVLAVLISFLIGVLLPTASPTTEMLARGNPSLLDAAVALVSGLVAAFALARKEIPVALAGVAIAAALMPPICTIGLGMALGDTRLAAGATLLFLTNITFIVMAENVIFLWMGMRPGRRQETQRGVAAWWTVISILLVTVVGLIVTLGRAASTEVSIEDRLLAMIPAAESVSIEEREREDGALSVLFTVRSPQEITSARVAELESELEADLGLDVALDLINLRVIEPTSTEGNAVRAAITTLVPDAEIVDLTVVERDALQLTLTLRTSNPAALDDAAVNLIAGQVANTLGRPVRLSLVVQPRFDVEVTPEPEAPTEPESTPEADNGT